MVTPLSHAKRVKYADLYVNKMTKETQRAFLFCAHLPFLVRSAWYLGGGTALALQVGHRQSVDLDFFTPQARFQERNLEHQLFETGHWKTTFRQRGTIYGILKDARVSFIAYPFFQPSPKRVHCGYLRMLTPPDIAAMKIIAISQRGRKRDFVDLYWYVTNQESIDVVIKRAVSRYPGQEKNMHHILKSLTYFDDAEHDPMPTLFFRATWKGIKKYFQQEIPKAARELLRL